MYNPEGQEAGMDCLRGGGFTTQALMKIEIPHSMENVKWIETLMEGH
jgi:hypothetical protein